MAIETVYNDIYDGDRLLQNAAHCARAISLATEVIFTSVLEETYAMGERNTTRDSFAGARH